MKKPEHFYRLTAEKHGLPLSLVTKINKFYWNRGIKRSISKDITRAIFIRNLGTLMISRYKIKEEIQELIRKIRLLKKSSFWKQTSKDLILEQYYGRLRKLLGRRNEIAIDYFKQQQTNKLYVPKSKRIHQTPADHYGEQGADI